ncbi:MAG: hypothetical protein [Olavius algarvensis Delta 4 endosymbiont]|nr:MAG: hypothetical protein [Olavius algarvensis Delta 4 endosymbiont]
MALWSRLLYNRLNLFLRWIWCARVMLKPAQSGDVIQLCRTKELC